MAQRQLEVTALVRARLDAWGVGYTEDDLAELVHAYEITARWRDLLAASLNDRVMSGGMAFPAVEPALTFSAAEESTDES